MMLIDLSMPMVSPVLHSFSFGTSTHPGFFSVHVAVRGGKLQGARCQNPANDANACITCRNGYVTV